MLSVVADEPAQRELTMSLDELAREGARRMLAAALETEVDASWPPTPTRPPSTATGWYAATATPQPGRSPPVGGRSRSPAPASTTAAWTPPPVSASSSTA